MMMMCGPPLPPTRPSRNPRHSNPYAQDQPPPWQAARASAVSTVTGPMAHADPGSRTDPWEGRVDQGMTALGALPLGPRASHHQGPPWQQLPRKKDPSLLLLTAVELLFIIRCLPLQPGAACGSGGRVGWLVT